MHVFYQPHEGLHAAPFVEVEEAVDYELAVCSQSPVCGAASRAHARGKVLKPSPPRACAEDRTADGGCRRPFWNGKV